METKLEELERRLALAEHQVKARCRVGRALGGLALAVLVVALTTTARGAKMQPAGHIVKAPFRVVDSRGKTLLCVEATAGGGELNLFGQDGKLSASLDAHSAAGGSLIILDSRGEIVASLSAGLRSEQGREVAGYGALTVSNGDRRWPGGATLAAGSDGGQLTIHSNTGPEIAELGATRNGGRLLFHATSNLRRRASGGGVTVHWVSVPGAELGSTVAGGWLGLYDKNGKVVFRNP
jgi:hypothetical protein